LIKEKFDSETIGLEEGCEDKPFSITIVPVKESGYVNLYGLDVTERFKVENELRMAYEKLKKSQAQLVQSGKMSAIGQLSSGVAHELNNPLTGILSGAQILKVSFDDPKAFKLEDFKELIDIMEESALRCKKIVRSLLDFSHAGLSELRPLSLNDLADRVVNLVEYDMRLRDVYIRRQFSADLPSITGDSALLQQVIFNMVSNAGWAIEQKQNRSEKGIIVLDTKYLKESKTVCLTISDNGIGVKFENMSRLFEPFFTTKPVGQGPGLSLSVCYSIIKEHGGSIEAASVEGKGTDFRITLPT
jgi:C4-dicarboxylate-specific signal transduction histidine kinase